MLGIAEMFAELDGRDRLWEQCEIVFPLRHARQQERWRESKRWQRTLKRDDDSYAKRWESDAAFREHRRAYWREYDKRRGRTASTRGPRKNAEAGRYLLAAKREIAKRIAARKYKPRGTPPIHGTVSTYKNQRCRCAECRLANKVYEEQRRGRADERRVA